MCFLTLKATSRSNKVVLLELFDLFNYKLSNVKVKNSYKN